MSRQRIDLPDDRIAEFCARWHVTELALLGSGVRGELGPDSDLDILATFSPEAEWSLLDSVRMEQELEQLLGRKVDLLTGRSVEQSQNWILRREILSTAEAIYGP